LPQRVAVKVEIAETTGIDLVLVSIWGYIPFADAPERLRVVDFILPDRERDAVWEGTARAARPGFPEAGGNMSSRRTSGRS